MRWTHLIRFTPDHTGYATLAPAGGVYKLDRLLAVGDNVHAPGQTVAVFQNGRWTNKDGDPLTVLVRPKKGQPATQPKPHRVVRWIIEYGDDDEEQFGRPALCIPWLIYETPRGTVWEPAPFRPTCDDVTRRIEAASNHKE